MKKNYTNIIIFILIVSFAIYLWRTEKPQMPAEYKQALDSLTKANTALQAKQDKVDSVIKSYEDEIIVLNSKVDNIKERTTIVREYYHEVSKEAQSYNTTQVDSFLRNRFNY